MRILKLFLFLMAVSAILFVPAAAAEYSDVQPDDWYYEAVTRMTEDGILSGYGDGTFRPNDPIASTELFAILARSFDDPSLIPPVDQWGRAAWSEIFDWISYELFMGDFAQPQINRDMTCTLLLEAAGMPTLDQGLYDPIPGITEMLSDDVYSALVYGYISGYGDGSVGRFDILTRAQACQILYNAMYVNPDPEIPMFQPQTSIVVKAFSGEMDDEFEAWQKFDKILSKLPARVIDQFSGSGYTLWYAGADSYQRAWETLLDSEYSPSTAVFSRSGKMIIMSCLVDGTAYHEFGHYIRHAFCDDDHVEYLFEAELDGVIRAAGRDYAGTNEGEFFAEAYKVYVLHPEKLKTLAPMTYNYIDGLTNTVLSETFDGYIEIF